jgi:acetylornithine deacetylase/succinyl-diaminopimelate desuccinylase-like protein
MTEVVRDACHALAQEHGCTVDIESIWRSAAVTFSDDCIDAVQQAAIDYVGEGGYRKITAGAAGHYSVNTSYICPTSMVFIPSQNGVSHHPSEYSTPEDW